MSFASAAVAGVSLLLTASSSNVMLVGSILTIIVMLLFFTRAALWETPQWDKRYERPFFALAIPLSVAFVIIIAMRIELALAGVK